MILLFANKSLKCHCLESRLYSEINEWQCSMTILKMYFLLVFRKAIKSYFVKIHKKATTENR